MYSKHGHHSSLTCSIKLKWSMTGMAASAFCHFVHDVIFFFIYYHKWGRSWWAEGGSRCAAAGSRTWPRGSAVVRKTKNKKRHRSGHNVRPLRARTPGWDCTRAARALFSLGSAPPPASRGQSQGALREAPPPAPRRARSALGPPGASAGPRETRVKWGGGPEGGLHVGLSQ